MNNKFRIIEKPAYQEFFHLEQRFDHGWKFMGVLHSVEELMWLHKTLTDFLLSKDYDPNDVEYFEEETMGVVQ